MAEFGKKAQNTDNDFPPPLLCKNNNNYQAENNNYQIKKHCIPFHDFQCV